MFALCRINWFVNYDGLWIAIDVGPYAEIFLASFDYAIEIIFLFFDSSCDSPCPPNPAMPKNPQ